MKKNDFLTKTLLFGAFALATAACSNEELTVVDPNINSGDDAPKLSITVKAPAGEGVIVRNATRAEETQDSYESALKSINVYLFQCATNSTQETDYTYSCTLTFKATADDNGAIAWQSDSEGKTCVTAIPGELMGKYVRMAIVANDAPTVPSLTEGSTTFYDFRSALATASLSTESGSPSLADLLVGSSSDMTASDATGFPMGAIVGSEATQFTAKGVSVEGVTLVRNVARIDICNYATDLVITSVKLTNANNKSYLFSGSSAVNVPSGQTAVTISPLAEYQARIGDSGLAYTNKEESSSDTEITDPTALKTLNTHRAFYLYEQAVGSSTNSPVVTIEYKVGDSSSSKTGSIDVKFENTTDGTTTYVANVVRNHIYTIQLGDGGAISTGEVTATFTVQDWTEGETIDEELTPDSDAVGS